MASSLSPEDLRWEVRAHLHSRPLASEDAATICRHLARKGHNVTPADAEAALTFLAGLKEPQVKGEHRGLGGSTRYWQITSAGILAHERNE